MRFNKQILRVSRNIQKFILFHVQSDQVYAKRRFKKAFGYKLNLSEPKRINEKLQWLKFNDKNPYFTIAADKFLVREEVKKRIGEKYLIPLVFQTKNHTEVSNENIKEFPVIVKPNHLCDETYVIFDESSVDWKELQEICRKWLRSNYYRRGREWQYRDIEPRIVVEKLLTNENGDLPYDYKFHCFNGEVKFLQVDTDRRGDHRRTFYSLEWDFIPFSWDKKYGKTVPKPDNLEEMIGIATKLCKEFYYCRVDLYSNRGSVYFGEITLAPNNGYGVITPLEWEYELGKYLKLPVEA